MSNGPMLNIFSAGVAKDAVSAAIAKWNKIHPDLPSNLTIGGSVDLVRRCLLGEPCDLIISADNLVFETLMVPETAKGYIIFAGNRMVVAANEGYDINSGNWQEKLLASDATFDHHDPHADPGGYRAVMSMLLADKIMPGLADKLLYHPGHFGMGNDPTDRPEIKYTFDYYTRALSRKAPIAELPEVMNLSNDDLSEIYAEVQFSLDSTTTVTATPINHALTIPETAKNHSAAKEFANLFLSIDFSVYGFIDRRKIIEKNILL